MKKIILNLLSVFLCGLTTQATANCCGQNYNDCCEWSILDGKMTVGADWLFWKVQQDGIFPGRIIVDEDSTAENDHCIPITKTRGIHTNPKWHSGFRVYLGYELPCDCWDVNLIYTYVPSHEKIVDFKSDHECKRFSSAFSDRDFHFFASKWNLSWNTIDLDIGRSVCFGECLKIRPHIGFRASWFDQKFRAFGAGQAIETPEMIVLFDALKKRQKFQGYGVEAGVWTDYKLACGLSLIGHFGGSILFSKFNVHSKKADGFITMNEETLSKIKARDISDEDVVTNATFGKDSFFIATPTLDYFVGLQYADSFCDMFFKVYLGWEQHVLFDTNRFLSRGNFCASRGNLCAQGMTLGLQVGF